MAQVTCRYCKKKIDKNKALSPRQRLNFCNDKCYQAWLNTEEGQKDTLLDYVWRLYEPERQDSSLYVMLKKQVEYYKREYNFKYQGMYLAVKYYVEVLERKWYDEYGIGQVLPTYYIMLQHMYEEQRALENKLLSTQPNSNTIKIVKGNKIKTRRKSLSMD